MTWNWRPELGRYRDHAANAAETPPFISAACPFLRHQTKITRLFEVSSCGAIFPLPADRAGNVMVESHAVSIFLWPTRSAPGRRK